MVNIIDEREVSIPLGIVVEKRKSAHKWANWNWKPVSVFMNADENAHWVEMLKGEEFIQYHAATLLLTIHRKETEALRLNLMLDQPELYVILLENDDTDSEFPWIPHKVTASSYDAQDFTDAGDDLVEKVKMPEAVAALIQAFVEKHHIEEEFIKRRRDHLDTEEQKFGKHAIFDSLIKH